MHGKSTTMPTKIIKVRVSPYLIASNLAAKLANLHKGMLTNHTVTKSWWSKNEKGIM